MNYLFLNFLFFGFSRADFSQLEEMWSNMTNSDVANFIMLMPRAAKLNIPGLDKLQGYGCWCMLGDNVSFKGRSGPVDFIDDACRIMQHGFECAVLDTPGCVPWEIKYESHSFNPVADEIYLPCYENNRGNDCATAACIIEANFLSNIFKAFFQMGQRPANAFVHKNGFNHDQNCPFSPMKASWSAGDKECLELIRIDFRLCQKMV